MTDLLAAAQRALAALDDLISNTSDPGVEALGARHELSVVLINAAIGSNPGRVLTLLEHDAAWHAIEGAAGEEGADPGTVLAAVLHALGIDPPADEDEMAASLRRDGFGDDEIAEILRATAA